MTSPGRAATPDELGTAYEARLGAEHRRRTGAFYTPAPIAAGVVALAADGLDLSPPARPTVCDPAMGGGAFVLAAARLLEAAGHDRATVVGHLVWGADVDPEAVAVARAALETWAAEVGVAAAATHLVCADSLAEGRQAWPDAPDAGFDLVVGNPPFLNQLGRRTARPADQASRLRARLGDPVEPYADASALFLAETSAWLAPGGRLALIVPESLLGARDAGPARAAARAAATLVGFWWPGTQVFDAMVDVCAPVLARPTVGSTQTGAGPVRRWFGPGFEPVSSVPAPRSSPPTGPWSRLLERSVPRSARVLDGLEQGPRLGSRAEATAGFRDHFYGIAPHVHDHAADRSLGTDHAHLVTVGLIDPLHNRWGAATTRFAGRRWEAPVVDVAAVAAADPRLGRWARARLVPKVLLATQTRVLEPVVDRHGRWWPSVPAIAVTPCGDDPDELWAIAAVLASPAVSAWALAHYRGTALSRDAVKLSATQVLDIPLPVDAGAWAEGAVRAAQAQERAEAADAEGWHAALVDLGGAMSAAYGSGAELRSWWEARLPAWR